MPKRYKVEEIPVGELHQPEGWQPYDPFAKAYEKYAADPGAAEVRTVQAQTVGIPKAYEPNMSDLRGFCPDADSFNEVRRTREEQMTEIPVLERHDGSLWSYDDTGILTLYREYAPDAKVIVAIIGKDPDRGENRKKGVSTSKR